MNLAEIAFGFKKKRTVCVIKKNVLFIIAKRRVSFLKMVDMGLLDARRASFQKNEGDSNSFRRETFIKAESNEKKNNERVVVPMLNLVNANALSSIKSK